MGIVRIEIAGSFGSPHSATFTALKGGHAFALQQAIQMLVRELPRAIQLDHELHAQGQKPPESDFGKLPASANLDLPRAQAFNVPGGTGPLP